MCALRVRACVLIWRTHSYQDQEDFREAARVLMGIPLDSGQRVLEPTYKIRINVRIARLFLEEDDKCVHCKLDWVVFLFFVLGDCVVCSVEAERFLNRASEIIHLCTDASLTLQYRVCWCCCCCCFFV